MNVIDQLAAIPELITLVIAAADIPHRDRGGKRGKVTGSPIPPSAACHMMLGVLRAKLGKAVSVVVEEMRQNAICGPKPPVAHSWSGYCAFLTQTAETWQADPFTDELVRGAVRSIHGQLTARLQDHTLEPTWPCPRCPGSMSRDRYLDDNREQLGCDSCGLILDNQGVAMQAQQTALRTPMPISDVAKIVGIPERTAQRWATLVRPVSTHTPTPWRPALYTSEQFVQLKRMIKK